MASNIEGDVRAMTLAIRVDVHARFCLACDAVLACVPNDGVSNAIVPGGVSVSGCKVASEYMVILIGIRDHLTAGAASSDTKMRRNDVESNSKCGGG